MNKLIRVKLGKMAQSAIEIAVDGVDEDSEACELAVARVFRGKELMFAPEEKDLIVRGLIEFSNSEDGQIEERAAADEAGKKHGRAAIRALQALIERVERVA